MATLPTETEFDEFQGWLRAIVRSSFTNPVLGIHRERRSDALIGPVAYLPLTRPPTAGQVDHAAAVASFRAYEVGTDWRDRVPDAVRQIVDRVGEDPLLIETFIRKRPIPPFLTYDEEEGVFVVNLGPAMEDRSPKASIGQRSILGSKRCLTFPPSAAIYYEPAVVGQTGLRAKSRAMGMFRAAAASSRIERSPGYREGIVVTQTAPGLLRITSAFDPELTDFVKGLPPSTRKFDGASKSWDVNEIVLRDESALAAAPRSLIEAMGAFRQRQGAG